MTQCVITTAQSATASRADEYVMPRINFTKRTLHCKVVYYGPEGAGTTASLEFVNRRAPAKGEGQLTSITSAHTPFEFMPMKLGRFDGMDTTLFVYTVPHNNVGSVRQSIMRDADAVIFVADSRPERMEANTRALVQLREDLKALGLNPASVPIVMQWNKRDLPTAVAVAELEAALNPSHYPSFSTSTVGDDVAVLAVLKKASLVALEKVADRFGLAKTQQISRSALLKLQRTTSRWSAEDQYEPKPRRTTARRSSSARLRAVSLDAPSSNKDFEVVGVTKRRRKLFSL